MAPPGKAQRVALAFLSIGALCGGFASILVRLCRYPAPAVACLRMVLAGLLLLPFCLGELRHTPAVGVHEPEDDLGRCVTLLGQRF
jgi:hypothetical protein